MKEIVAIKIGGSAITKKDIIVKNLKKLIDNYSDFVRIDVIREIASQIKIIKERFGIFIVHGVGPYGHQLVFNENWKKLSRNPDIIHKYCEFLAKIVKKEFEKVGFKTKLVEIFLHNNFNSFFDDVKKCLKNDILPISFGDIRLCDNSYEIISGDRIILESVKFLKISKVVMICDVDGVYTSNPFLSKNAKKIEVIHSSNFDLSKLTFSSNKIDVSGGMKSKLETLLKIAKRGVNGWIISYKNNSLIKLLMQNKHVGTLIKP